MRQASSRWTAAACLLALGGCLSSPVQPPDAEPVRACLDDLASGRGEWADLAVTYDDTHGLHGGLTLTFHGDGRVEQQAIRTKAREPQNVPRADLGRLVALLREVRAWEQRVPNRQAEPDESTARLTVRCGVAETTIWEWHNDLGANARIARVRALMAEIAWTPRPGQ